MEAVVHGRLVDTRCRHHSKENSAAARQRSSCAAWLAPARGRERFGWLATRSRRGRTPGSSSTPATQWRRPS